MNRTLFIEETANIMKSVKPSDIIEKKIPRWHEYRIKMSKTTIQKLYELNIAYQAAAPNYQEHELTMIIGQIIHITEQNENESNKFDGYHPSDLLENLAVLFFDCVSRLSNDNVFLYYQERNPLADARLSIIKDFLPDIGILIAKYDVYFRAQLKATVQDSSSINHLVVLPFGLVIVAVNHFLKIFDSETCKELRVLRGHKFPITAVLVLNDGRIASGDSAGYLIIWDLKANTSMILKENNNSINTILEVSMNIIITVDKLVLVKWDLNKYVYTGKIFDADSFNNFFTNVALLPNGNIILNTSNNSSVIFNPKIIRKPIDIIEFSSKPLSLVVFKEKIIIGLENGDIYISGEYISHGSAVRFLFILQDGRLVSGSDDSTIRVWNLNTVVCERVLTGPNAVKFLIKLNDNKLIASGFDNGRIIVWNVDTGLEVLNDSYFNYYHYYKNYEGEIITGRGLNNGVITAIKSLDNSKLVSGTSVGTIKFWD